MMPTYEDLVRSTNDQMLTILRNWHQGSLEAYDAWMKAVASLMPELNLYTELPTVAQDAPGNNPEAILDNQYHFAIEVGCGSSGVSWLRCEDVGFAVFGVVDALVFAAEVVAPVGVEVAAGDEGAEPEDGLGAFQPPSCARYVYSVLDDVPAGALVIRGR